MDPPIVDSSHMGKENIRFIERKRQDQLAWGGESMDLTCDAPLPRIRPYFRKPSYYEKTVSNDQNPYRLWKGFSIILRWFNVFYNKKTSENYEHRIKFLTLTSTKIIWSNRPAPMSACFPSFKKVNNFAAYQHDLMAHMGRVNNRGAQKWDFF